MTIDSYLWGTNLDTSDHPQGYNEREAQAILTAARGIPTNVCGVSTGFEVSIAGARTLSVSVGRAWVNGIFAWDDSTTTVIVPPVASDTAFIVVIEGDWTTQTCQIKTVKAVDGGLALPNLTQNVFDIWQIPLACGVMDNAGVFYQYFGMDWTDIRNTGSPARFAGVINDLRQFIGNQAVEQIMPDVRVTASGATITFDNFPQNYPVIRLSLNLQADSATITAVEVQINDEATVVEYMGTLKPLFADNVDTTRGSGAASSLPFSVDSTERYQMEVYIHAWRSFQRPSATVFLYGDGGEGMSIVYFDTASNFSNKLELIFDQNVSLIEATVYGIDNQQTFGY